MVAHIGTGRRGPRRLWQSPLGREPQAVDEHDGGDVARQATYAVCPPIEPKIKVALLRRLDGDAVKCAGIRSDVPFGAGAEEARSSFGADIRYPGGRAQTGF